MDVFDEIMARPVNVLAMVGSATVRVYAYSSLYNIATNTMSCVSDFEIET